MKILHLLDERWDSGITAYALQICGLLQKSGEQVTLGVVEGKKPERLAKEQGLHVVSYSNVFGLKNLLCSDGWDLINVHTGRAHTWTVLLRLSGATRRVVPIIRTRGDARPVSTHPGMKLIYKKTAAVIAASDHIGKQYEADFRFPDDRRQVIYPSVEADAQPSPLPMDRIGILGRLDPVKGHVFFLEAAAFLLKEFPALRFFVAGKEANVSTSLLLNQARTLGIEKSVQFLGFHPDAREFMRSCGVGVIASIGSEEISRACLEWMAAGRPVVGTLVGSLPELIEPEETGLLVKPDDSRALAESISRLLKNKDEAAGFGKNAWNLVKRKFGPDVQLEKTRRLYQHVCGKLEPSPH